MPRRVPRAEQGLVLHHSEAKQGPAGLHGPPRLPVCSASLDLQRALRESPSAFLPSFLPSYLPSFLPSCLLSHSSFSLTRLYLLVLSLILLSLPSCFLSIFSSLSLFLNPHSLFSLISPFSLFSSSSPLDLSLSLLLSSSSLFLSSIFVLLSLLVFSLRRTVSFCLLVFLLHLFLSLFVLSLYHFLSSCLNLILSLYQSRRIKISTNCALFFCSSPCSHCL